MGQDLQTSSAALTASSKAVPTELLLLILHRWKTTGMGGLGAWLGGGQQSASFTWGRGKGQDKGLKWEGKPSPTHILPKEPGCAPSPPKITKTSPETQPTAPPAPALRTATASLPVTTTVWLGTDRLFLALENVKLIGKSHVWDRGGCPAAPRHTSQGNRGDGIVWRDLHHQMGR